MTPPTNTADTIDIIKIIDTRVPGTSAAHAVVPTDDDDTRWITIVWSTAEVACIEFELGDITHGGPVQYAADTPPPVESTDDGDWRPAPDPRCSACGSTYGPLVDVLDGRVKGRKLVALALGIARDAAADRAWVASRVTAHLVDLLNIEATGLIHGSTSLDELPTVMEGPGVPAVVRDGDRLVAFTHVADDDIIEVRWPLPTPLPEMVDDLGPFEDDEDDDDGDDDGA